MMARTVEVLGAPGAGKSSLVAAADGVRLTDGSTIRDARAALRSRRFRGPLGSLPVLSRATRDPSPAERTAALLRWRDAWAPFLRLSADQPPDRGVDPLLRLSRVDWLLRSLELAALAVEHGPNGRAEDWLLLDEGPAQRALGTPDAGAFAALVPAPRAAVLVEVDGGVLEERLARRVASGRAILRHRDLDPGAAAEESMRDAALLAAIASGLAARGVPVLQVDGAVPLPEAVDGLRRWLQSLEDGQRRPPARPGT